MADIGTYASGNADLAKLLNSAIVVNDYGALVRASTAYDWQTRAQVAINTRRRLDLNLLGRRLQADLVEGSVTNECIRSIPNTDTWASSNVTDTLNPTGVDPVFTGISVVEQEVTGTGQPHIGRSLGLASKLGRCCVSAFFKKHPTTPSACAVISMYKGADGSNIKTIINGTTIDTGVAYDGTISAGNNIIRLGWISGSTINHNYAYNLGLLWNGIWLTDAQVQATDERIRLWN